MKLNQLDKWKYVEMTYLYSFLYIIHVRVLQNSDSNFIQVSFDKSQTFRI